MRPARSESIVCPRRGRSPARASLPALFLVAVGTLTSAQGFPPEVVEAVPGDVVAVCFNAGPQAPDPTTAPAGGLHLATGLLDRASELGLLSSVDVGVRGWIDALVSLAMVARHPHAIVLMDIAATPRPGGGHRFGRLQAAVIIHIEDGREALERRIQHLLSTYTNSEETLLTRDLEGQDAVFSLRDRRLEEWAVVQWGAIDDLYVVAIGEGAFRRIREAHADGARRLAADAWFARAFQATNASRAAAACYVSLDAARPATDPVLVEKIQGVQDALDLGDVRRALWTLHRTGRSFELAAFLNRADGDELRLLAGEQFLAALPAAAAPPQATGVTAIGGSPQTLFRAACEAYLATQRAASRAQVTAYWGEIEVRSGVDVDRDILPHLGGPIVIHNHPAPILRVPPLWTIVVPVTGDAATLRRHISRFLEFVDQELAAAGAPRLRRDDDETWWLNIGISGPAVNVSQHWLVLSFSPSAVRANIALLEPPGT